MPRKPSSTPASATGGGILWMLLTTLLFVAGNAVTKSLTQDYAVAQVLWGRYAFHLALMIPVVWHERRALHRSRTEGLHVLRGGLLLGTSGLFALALRVLPLADCSALMFVAPLLVTALSPLLLGETVDSRRWLAVGVGFLGALVVVRPGLGVFGPVAVVPLGAAFFYALFQISTRRLGGQDGVLLTMLYATALAAAATTLVLPWVWSPPTPTGWVQMILLGALSALSQATLIKAFASAPASVVSPFGYVTLVWAIGIGFVLFGEQPDPFTILGAALIIFAGLVISAAARRRP